jgi:hypothetical protein
MTADLRTAVAEGAVIRVATQRPAGRPVPASAECQFNLTVGNSDVSRISNAAALSDTVRPLNVPDR